MEREYVIRYAITGRHGKRRYLASPGSGPASYATEEEAKEHLRAMLANNSKDRLDSVFGKGAVSRFEVRPVKCIPSGTEPFEIL